MEKLESQFLLNLKALREGTCNMGEFTAFSQHLVIQVRLELCTLLKVVLKAHLEIQVMLIDVQQYKATWVVGAYQPCLRSWTSQEVPERLFFYTLTAKEKSATMCSKQQNK